MAAALNTRVAAARSLRSVEIVWLALAAGVLLFFTSSSIYSDTARTVAGTTVAAAAYVLLTVNGRPGPRHVVITIWSLLLALGMVVPTIGGKGAVSAIFTPSPHQLTTAAYILCAAVWGAICAARPVTDLSNLVVARETAAAKLPIWPLCLPLGMFIIAAGGPGALWSRSSYLFGSGSNMLFVFSTSLTLPCACVLAYKFAVGESAKVRTAAALALGAYFLLFLSQASRRLAVATVAVTAIRLLFGAKRHRKAIAVFGLWFSLVTLSLPLTLRSGTHHGLSSYLPKLTTESLRVSSGPKIFASNVGFAYPLAGVVATDPRKEAKAALATSLSPLPGGMVGWPTVSRQLRINVYTPFSGMGELGQAGLPAVFIYTLLATTVFQVLAVRACKLRESLRAPCFLLYLGLSGFFALSVLQYNLRSASRLAYYAVIVGIGLAGTQLLPARHPSSSRTTSG